MGAAEVGEGARQGPLRGVRVVEFAGLGPAPFAGMMLADMGADVVLIERPGTTPTQEQIHFLDMGRYTLTNRGKRSVTLDLKNPAAVETALRLVQSADVLIEGYRPGVMERIGLGPEVCLGRNAKLVYGRMTGWGQSGPMAQMAGHDLNYVALTGLLDLGRKGADGVPWAAPTVVGDMAGGAMFLAFGIAAALFEARRSGQGQVIDAAVSDGASLLGALIHSASAAGLWTQGNMMQGDAHYYNVYRCADGLWVSVGALEPQFYKTLRDKLGLQDEAWDTQADPGRWPALRRKLEEIFATRRRDEWCELFAGSDACFAPVLELPEVHRHPHHQARGNFLSLDGITQPAPAPRLSRTPGAATLPPPARGADSETVLRDWGWDEAEVQALRQGGVFGRR